MRKTQKQLLGLAGLVAVGIMTATACMLPTPDAAAAEGDSIYDEQPESNGDFQVQVTVESGISNASTTSPSNNQEYSKLVIPVSIRYERISRMVSMLSYIDEAGNAKEVVVDDYTPTGAAQDSGIRTFNIDLANHKSANNQYKLTTQAYNFQGEALPADVVTFSYASTVVKPSPKPEEGGNPSIDVDINDEVEKVVIQVWDKEGKPLLVDEDGNPAPIVVNKDAFDKDGNLTIELPLEDLGLKEGDYTVTIDSYDKDNNIISQRVTEVEYEPVTPDVPNTGNLLGDLNITRLDYIVTGLIAFGLIAGFAIYLALRRSRR